jgi:F-box/leucine-rich repeat protein 7
MGCKNLRELDLSFCGSAVSDASLSTISVHLKLLQRLSIRGCVRVTTAGLSAVRMGCPNLEHFDYSQCINVDATPK